MSTAVDRAADGPPRSDSKPVQPAGGTGAVGRPGKPGAWRPARWAGFGHGNVVGVPAVEVAGPGAETLQAGETPGSPRTLEGNKAHGRRGSRQPATGTGTLDPTVEQRPEVEGRRHNADLRGGRGGGATARGQRRWKHRAATGGGTSSRGVNGATGTRLIWRMPAGRLRMTRWQAAGGRPKRGEPLLAPGCNKPGSPSAEQTVEVVRNHAGGTHHLVTRMVEERRRRRTGTRTQTGDVGGGAHWLERIPREAGAEIPGDRSRRASGADRRSEDEAKITRDAPLLNSTVRSIVSGKTLETRPATEEGQEGSGEGQRAATARDGRRPGQEAGNGLTEP